MKYEEMKTRRLPMEQLVQLVLLQLEQGGFAYLTITGSSMRPLFREQTDRVRLVPVEKLASGDIILYQRSNGQYVLHRILRLLDEKTYLCCGDNQWETEIVEAYQLLAVVSYFYRGKKEYSVRHFGYRCYVRFWVAMHPVRRPLLAVRRRLGKLRTAYRKKKMRRKGK